MSEVIRISIPAPCHEDWNKMTPKDNGRFCSVCCKTVVDFTMMSDEEVFNYWSSAKEKPCGRFKEDQLNRPIYKGKKNLWKWLIMSVASMIISNKTKAQGVRPIEKPLSLQQLDKNTTKILSLHIKGTVKDTGGKPVSVATVIGENRGSLTDANGVFSFVQSILADKDSITLTIIRHNFLDQKVKLSIAELKKPLNIVLQKKEPGDLEERKSF